MKSQKKKKGDKMAEIVGDAYDERYVDKANVIASALWLLAKSTKWEEDVKQIILACSPRCDFLKKIFNDNFNDLKYEKTSFRNR